MPLHSYKCPVCNWTGDRIVKTDERDKQVCNRTIEVGGLSPNPLEGTCLGELKREEIALNAKMRHQWMP